MFSKKQPDHSCMAVQMNTHILFVFIFAVILCGTIFLDVNASNDNNICEGLKQEKYTTKGWWWSEKTKYRTVRTIKCCDGYTGKPPNCLRKSAIEYKAVNEYTIIWRSKGSPSFTDVSIWRPKDAQSEYFPLGDTVVADNSGPKGYSLVVKAVESISALAEPESFEKIWNDTGSGAKKSVTIYKMIPKSGYTCLGHIAVDSYQTLPETSVYRCVLSSYVITDGTYEGIWKSSGSIQDVKLLLNSESNSNKGVFANTFTAKLTNSKPQNNLYLLNSDYAKLHTFSIVEKLKQQHALKVYAIPNKANLLWKDDGIGANDDVSIYKARKLDGYVSLGNIAEGTYDEPEYVFLVKSQKSEALKKPTDFRKVFETKLGNNPISFWRPICPSQYKPLGHLANVKEPSLSDVMCVNEKYIIEGDWVRVWDTKGSTASGDVTIFRAVSKIESGTGIHAMSTVEGLLDEYDTSAYVLKSDSIEYAKGLPVKQYIITNVNYDFDSKTVMDEASQELQSKFFRNNKNEEKLFTSRIELATVQENNWSSTEGFQQDITISVTAGVTYYDTYSESYKLTTSDTHKYKTGGSDTEKIPHSYEVSVTVQPRRKQRVSIVSKAVIVNIPYTATLVKVYTDGKSEENRNFEGVYQAVASSCTVIYSNQMELN